MVFYCCQEVWLGALTNPDYLPIFCTFNFQIERVLGQNSLKLWNIRLKLGRINSSLCCLIMQKENIEIFLTAKNILKFRQLIGQFAEVIISKQCTFNVKKLGIENKNRAFFIGVNLDRWLNSLIPKWIHWLHIWWFHHDALENSCLCTLRNNHCMILIIFINELMFWLRKRTSNSFHILLPRDKPIVVVVFVELHPVILCLISWKIIVVPIANSGRMGISWEKNWHVVLELHRVALNIFMVDLDKFKSKFSV